MFRSTTCADVSGGAVEGGCVAVGAPHAAGAAGTLVQVPSLWEGRREKGDLWFV